MSVGVVIKDETDTYGQNGFISQNLSSDKYKELGKEEAGKIKLPILGNIKDFSGGVNDSAGTTHIAEPINPEEDDSLPF